MAPPKTEPSDDRERMGALEVMEMAESLYHFARSTDGGLIAYPRDPKAPRIAVGISSLRPMLISRMREARNIVGPTTMTTALQGLEAQAAAGREERVFLRAATHGAALYLDLARPDAPASFVEISAHGWEVVSNDEGDRSLPLFRRSGTTKALPIPERFRPARGRAHPREAFAELLGLDVDEPRFRLIWGWLVASLFEARPRPLLWALGPQGSGKSTRARMVLSVVEPCDALGRPPGESERDDSTSARSRYLPSWDNVGSIGDKTSDWLCRLVTGVEIDRRALFTDTDVVTTILRRSGVATSIVLPYGVAPDALERLLLVEFDRVADTERKPEGGLWEAFRALHPTLLGCLLDDVSGALAALPGVTDRQPEHLPRMADYALVLAALDEHLGEPTDEGYLSAYVDAVSGGMAERATDDPMTAALLTIARNADGGTWRGTAEALHRLLKPHQPDDYRAPWPSSPRSLGHALVRASETLRAAGLVVDKVKSNGQRMVVLRTIDPGTTLEEAA